MKYLSLFSGIGGFELGLQNSNKKFECIGYSEIDKYANSIYRRHFPKHKPFGNVTKIKTKKLPKFNLLVGGFPCQSFSIAGHRKGFNDTRGTLFFEIARILKDKKPKYFLLENVRNLLSHDKGRTFQTILKVLSKIGYDVQWQILNSKDFGVPQNRERIFLKGHFRDKCEGEILSFTKPSRKTNAKLDYLSDTLTATGQNCGNSQLVQLNKGKSQGQRIYDSNGLSCTLSTNGGGQGAKTGLYKLNNKVRKLTPVECERLQAFPDNWTEYGVKNEKISDTQRYKCCGNTVTTTVITTIINQWRMK